MTTWQDVGRAAPELADRVRALFVAHRHGNATVLIVDWWPPSGGLRRAERA